MAALSILSVAVASSRAGYVFLSDGRLYDWGMAEGGELFIAWQFLVGRPLDAVLAELEQCRADTGVFVRWSRDALRALSKR